MSVISIKTSNSFCLKFSVFLKLCCSFKRYLLQKDFYCRKKLFFKFCIIRKSQANILLRTNINYLSFLLVWAITLPHNLNIFYFELSILKLKYVLVNLNALLSILYYTHSYYIWTFIYGVHSLEQNWTYFKYS